MEKACSAQAEPCPSSLQLDPNIFGSRGPVSHLRSLLAALPNLALSLSLSGSWWTKAKQISADTLETWTISILDAVAADISDRCTDDLFSDAKDDVAKGLLEILGFKLATSLMSPRSPSSPQPSLQLLRPTRSVPTDFLRNVLRHIGGNEAKACIELLVSPFKGIRLDRLLRDDLDPQVLAALKEKSNKNLAMIFGFALEAEARGSKALDFPGPFECSSCLTPLLAVTPIVPFGALPHHAKKLTCHAKEYFTGLANFPLASRNDIELQLGMVRTQLHEIHELTKSLIERSLKQPAHREGVIAWLARAIELNSRHLQKSGHQGIFDDAMTGRSHEAMEKCCSSGFILNLATVLLQLLMPVCDRADDFLAQIDLSYIDQDWRLDFSSQGKLREGPLVSSGEDATMSLEIGPGYDEDDEGDEDSDSEDEEAAMLAAAMEMSMKPYADPSFFPVDGETNESTNSFKFPTEAFWLTGRAMELVHKMVERRYEHERSALEFVNRVKGASTSSSSSPSSALRVAEGSLAVLRLGWDAQLYDPAFLTKACSWAEFSAKWIRMHLSAKDAAEHFAKIPAGLVKSMCDVWRNAAFQPNPDVMPGLMAADAAVFCTELMGRPDLVTSPVVQDQCLNVLDAFLRTSADLQARKMQPQSPQPHISNGALSNNLQGSPYFGSRRGLAGAVMDNQRIREELAPALMRLYAECHAVAGLDVDEDIGFDKFSIRHRSNALLTFLWHHPLQEPRKSIINVIVTDRGGTSRTNSAATAEISPFDAFLGAAFDTIMYNFDDALRRIRDGRREEQSAGQQASDDFGSSSTSLSSSSLPPPPPQVPSPHTREGHFYAAQQRAAKNFISRSDSTFTLLNLFAAEDTAVRRCIAGFHPLRTTMECNEGSEDTFSSFASPAIGQRTAQVLYTCLHEQCNPEKEDAIAVIDPEKWGFARDEHLRMPSSLLASLLDPSTLSEGERTTFLRSLRSHVDYDYRLWRRVAKCAGGECIQPFCDILEGSELLQHREENNAIDWQSWMAEFEAAEHGSCTKDESTYNAAYAAAYEEAEQVSSIDDEESECFEGNAVENGKRTKKKGFEKGGEAHYFRRRTSSVGTATANSVGEASGRALKIIMKEYRKLARGQLPVPHPNASIALRYDEDHPSFCRAVITGPADTPYFGGFFVFDVKFPAEYPNVPPMVQLVTTGQGTVRFNPNLYQDGKVCLSVLGTWHGHASEKWNPSESSLYQVLLSIQTQILIAEPYFNEPGMEGQRSTTEGRLRSAEQNEQLRLDTIRHAIVGVLRSCRNSIWPELKPILKAHFGRIRLRLFADFKNNLEALIAQGSKKATAKTSFERAIKECKAEIDHLLSEDGSAMITDYAAPPHLSVTAAATKRASPSQAEAIPREASSAKRSPDGQAEAKRARSVS